MYHNTFVFYLPLFFLLFLPFLLSIYFPPSIDFDVRLFFTIIVNIRFTKVFFIAFHSSHSFLHISIPLEIP